MTIIEVIFWLCVGCVTYTYFAYPALVGLWSKLRSRPIQRRPFRGSFSIVLCVHNEETTIARRLEELCGHVRGSGLEGEIIVVSDGSTDATAATARRFEATGIVRVEELLAKSGKAAALTHGCQSARGEILVFADVRQTWAKGAIPLLLENFADAHVGAVSGDLVLETSPGVLAGVGLYWRFEKWLRHRESAVWSQVGVTGAISAVRRELFVPVPPGTLLDDVYWPLCVALAGHRVVHDERARAFDRLPDRSRDEFRRKVRTLCGNYQLVCRLPRSLWPWRNRVWLAWVSHKLLRLVAPWALLGALGSSALLSGYEWAFWGQLGGYGLGLAGMIPALGKRVKLLGAGASFLVLNAAAWLAFWVWLTGRSAASWRPVSYESRRGVAKQVCTSR